MLVGFDPDRMGLSPVQIRRRIREMRVFPRPGEQQAVEELVKIFEADWRLATATEYGMIDEEAKERAHALLDSRLNAALAQLSKETRDACAGLMIPRFLDGGSLPHVLRPLPYVPVQVARVRVPHVGARRKPARRRVLRALARAPGRPPRQDDEDDPDLLARYRGSVYVVAA